MELAKIIDGIERVAPLSYADTWDHSGIQVASVRKNAQHLGVMLDPTLCSITKAIDLGADVLLSHHPLSMKPKYPDTQDDYFAILSLLLTKKICLYSAHTSLDANPHGPVRWFADALHVVSPQILEPLGEEHGFGFYGDLATSLPYDAFCKQIEKSLGISQWKACGKQPDIVRSIACCPGSGASLAEHAEAQGVDVFITGDIKYHTALDTRIRIIDVGHFILEEEMMRIFAEILSKDLSIPVSFIPSKDPLFFERA